MALSLKAITDGRFIDEQTIRTLTGWTAETFEVGLESFSLLANSGHTARLNEREFEVIFQAVMQLSNYPIDNYDDLESFLGVSRLHLGWFWYMLSSIRDDWEEKVEEDNLRIMDEDYAEMMAKDRR